MAHKIVYHATLGSSEIRKKKKYCPLPFQQPIIDRFPKMGLIHTWYKAVG